MSVEATPGAAFMVACDGTDVVLASRADGVEIYGIITPDMARALAELLRACADAAEASPGRGMVN